MRALLLEKPIFSKFLKKCLLSWNLNLHFQVCTSQHNCFYSAGFELAVPLKIKRKCACAVRQCVWVSVCVCVCVCVCARARARAHEHLLFSFQLLKNLTYDVFALLVC
jgi:hypothetical protein